MQIDEKEEKDELDITFEDTIVNIDYAIIKLRHHNRERIENIDNPWPETAYIYRESAVLSNQLWLHNIKFCQLHDTYELLEQYQLRQQKANFNNQIITYYNFDLQLNIIIKSENKWIDNNIFFDIKRLTVFNYVQYLIPLIKITSKSIISTIVARVEKNSPELLGAEIISVGEFRQFYLDNNCCDWRYQKETQELYRWIEFQFYHNYDIFKAVNYKVQQRVILQLSQFVYLEIVIIKQKYFQDIREYYLGQNQLLTTSIVAEFDLDQPHQIDRFDSVDHIITEYYPQQ